MTIISIKRGRPKRVGFTVSLPCFQLLLEEAAESAMLEALKSPFECLETQVAMIGRPLHDANEVSSDRVAAMRVGVGRYLVRLPW